MKSGFVLILGLVEPAQGKTRVNLSSQMTGVNCSRDGIKYLVPLHAVPRDWGRGWNSCLEQEKGHQPC